MKRAILLFAAVLALTALPGRLQIRYDGQGSPLWSGAGPIPSVFPSVGVSEACAQNARGDLPGAVERFRAAYRAKNSPRIAVLVNRELSAEVREWVSDSRFVVASGYTGTKGGDGKETAGEEVTGGVSAYHQQRAEPDYRPNPGETWIWEFEDGFMKPFLDAGARMVDRATIMRLAAASGQGDRFAPLAVKKVEMDALKGYADAYIEILISNSPGSPSGYEFRASAREVSTGIIITSVSSLRWPKEYRKQHEIRATSRGYEIVDRVPPPGEVSSDLALDLMNAMARTWQE